MAHITKECAQRFFPSLSQTSPQASQPRNVVYVPVSDPVQFQQMFVPTAPPQDVAAVPVNSKTSKKRGNRGSRKPKSSVPISDRHSVSGDSSSEHSTPSDTRAALRVGGL